MKWLAVALLLAACEESFRPYLPAAAVRVTPDTVTMRWGARTQLQATVTDSAGGPLPGRPITWTSSNPAVARVTSGEVFAQGGGVAVITATSGPAAGQAGIVVHVPVAYVTFPVTSQTVLLQGRTRLAAVPRDSTGGALLGRPITWTSSDTTIAAVDSGMVVARGEGTATITATSEGHAAQVALIVEAVTFSALAAGATEHTCGLVTDGRAFCWGSDILGELGNGPGGALFNHTPIAVAGGLTFVSITGGGRFTCGVTDTSGGVCWGSGARGRLGNGSLDNNPSPGAITGGLDFLSVSTGFAHGCGESGSVAFCWGSGPALGSAGGKYGLTPVLVEGEIPVRNMDAGDDFTCALDASDAAVCWGINFSGQLGRGDSASSIAPVRVAGQHTFAHVAAGSRHACGLTTGGAVWCWGENSAGQLGIGSQVAAATPQLVTDAPVFTALAAGSNYSCGLTDAGEAWCWGGNAAGQMGDGTTEGRLIPTPAGGGLRFRLLALGSTHACGLGLDGIAYCWGANGSGQLGDGTTSSRTTPVRVLGQR